MSSRTVDRIIINEAARLNLGSKSWIVLLRDLSISGVGIQVPKDFKCEAKTGTFEWNPIHHGACHKFLVSPVRSQDFSWGLKFENLSTKQAHLITAFIKYHRS